MADACTDTAIRNWQELYFKTQDPAYSNSVSALKQFRQQKDYIYPIPKGFAKDIRELTERYASDLEEQIAALNLSPGGGDDNGTAPRPGCLLPLILLAVLACVVLQLTGTVDFVGWIENLFNMG